jgi:hypothetical protein
VFKYINTKGIHPYRLRETLEIGDDEGEVMFFNVEYDCDKK